MSKIILFGGSGFVGKTLQPMLKQRGLEYGAPGSAEINLVDANAVDAVAKLVCDGDTVVMLSAYTPEKGDAGEMTLKNIAMVQHLLLGIGKRTIAQFIYISSDAVYPITADMIDEQAPTCPTDLYGQMHLMREQYVRRAMPAEKLAILRPCAIYGVGDTHLSYGINRFVKTARDQKEINLFGEGEEFRDHIFCEDFAKLMVAVIEKRWAGLLNVASGKAWRFGDIAQWIQHNAGHDVRINCKPRASAITHRHVNTTALLKQFPEALPRPIEQGLASLITSAAAAA